MNNLSLQNVIKIESILDKIEKVFDLEPRNRNNIVSLGYNMNAKELYTTTSDKTVLNILNRVLDIAEVSREFPHLKCPTNVDGIINGTIKKYNNGLSIYFQCFYDSLFSKPIVKILFYDSFEDCKDRHQFRLSIDILYKKYKKMIEPEHLLY